MPNWHDILKEISASGCTHDVIRRKYLLRLHRLTRRNAIIYYSGWLQKPDAPAVSVNDVDKNGLMTVVHKLDRSIGLDLLLHTPGGDLAATESIVDYLRAMFGSDIRAIVPQLALSAGTMIACACREIVMGKQSSLGPVDPQMRGGVPAHGILEEFQQAYDEIKGTGGTDAAKHAVWQHILSKYPPTLIGECKKAIQWSNDLVSGWLRTGMLEGDPDADPKLAKILDGLGNHALSLSHSRHLSAETCRAMGLKISTLEENPKLQDAVLSVHHACMLTLSSTDAIKLIENHLGIAFTQAFPRVVIGGAR